MPKYRLAHIKENKPYRQRSICKMVLKQDTWLTVKESIEFGAFKSLVEEYSKENNKEKAISLPLLPETTTNKIDCIKLKKFEIVNLILKKSDIFTKSELTKMKKSELMKVLKGE